MSRKFVMVVAGTLATSVLLVSASPTAKAVPQFKKEFDALYVKPDSENGNEKVFAETVEKVKCDVCHVPKKPKKMRNGYGEALSQFLDHKADKNNKEKIIEALEKVAAMKSVADDDNAPTFGELIAAGKLPGGEVDDAAGATADASGGK